MDVAIVRLDKSGHQVEERCLSGAVRPNQTDDLVLTDTKINRIDGDDTAEAFGQTAGFKISTRPDPAMGPRS